MVTGTEASRGGGSAKRVKFELPTVGEDYRQRSQWEERLVNNCAEALNERTKCVQLKFAFFAVAGQRKRSIGDPGSDYDSDELGECKVTDMSTEGKKGKLIPVDSRVSIEVVCNQAEEEQPDDEDEAPPPSN